MKKINYIIVLLTTFIVHSQTAFKNHSGSTFQLHPGAEVGFHTDLLNEGTINDTQNTGFAGFYSNNETRKVGGTNRPEFHDVDIATINSNLELEVSLAVTNNFSFVEGKVITPKDQPNDISLDLIGHQFAVGQDDDHHVDGYNSVVNFSKEFIFPIGDGERLRPMILPNASKEYKGAYFFENPNSASKFFTNFDTEIKSPEITKISELEFWDLDGESPTEIALTWDSRSKVDLLVKDIKKLTVVGWDKVKEQWVDLGNKEVSGNLSEGLIKSLIFLPNSYSIITLASSKNNLDSFCKNKLNTFSPDNDGINDLFKLECSDNYPPGSTYQVYDRLGSLVFKSKSITEPWNGFSYENLTINKSNGLPKGVYFYLVTFKNDNGEDDIRKGWIYLIR